jgi:hypothetical protein
MVLHVWVAVGKKREGLGKRGGRWFVENGTVYIHHRWSEVCDKQVLKSISVSIRQKLSSGPIRTQCTIFFSLKSGKY